MKSSCSRLLIVDDNMGWIRLLFLIQITHFLIRYWPARVPSVKLEMTHGSWWMQCLDLTVPATFRIQKCLETMQLGQSHIDSNVAMPIMGKFLHHYMYNDKYAWVCLDIASWLHQLVCLMQCTTYITSWCWNTGGQWTRKFWQWFSQLMLFWRWSWMWAYLLTSRYRYLWWIQSTSLLWWVSIAIVNSEK